MSKAPYDPVESQAESLRDIRDSLEELVEETRMYRETFEMVALTDEQRDRLAKARKERT